MEFDKTKVYTALNADELKPGDKVLTSNNIASLKEAVRLDVEPSVIVTIWAEMYGKRFKCKSSNTIYDAELAYLVERKENCTNCAFNITSECDKSEWKEEAVKVFKCGEYMPKTEMPELIPLGNGQYAERKHYRPFKDTDELIKVWCEKAKATPPVLDMPYIWVRYKNLPKTKGMLINGFEQEVVYVMGTERTMQEVLDKFVFLDGSPCGVEE